MQRQIVSRNALIEEVNRLSRENPSRVYVLSFKRATPKCPNCGAKNAKWVKGVDKHCICGGEIEYDANVECKIRMMTNGTFKYFDLSNHMKNCVCKNINWIRYYNSENSVNGDLVELFPYR